MNPEECERIYGYDEQFRYDRYINKGNIKREVICIECDDRNKFRMFFANNVLVFYTKIFSSISYKEIIKQIEKSYPDCEVVLCEPVFRKETKEFMEDVVPEKIWSGKIQDMPKSFEEVIEGGSLYFVYIISKGNTYDLQCFIDSNSKMARVSYIYKGYKEIIEMEEKARGEEMKKEKAKKDALLNDI